ncbi:MAG TPA: hypothetical protein VJN42_06330 [Candidatus Acidoferrum sp.]|nr:hypothetical protein [Candidatus Acidoferrum sp.]
MRLNSAIGYVTPRDVLGKHQQEIFAERDRKLEAAEGTAEESPPAGRVSDETDYFWIAEKPGVDTGRQNAVMLIISPV